jgi:hypothetical protein
MTSVVAVDSTRELSLLRDCVAHGGKIYVAAVESKLEEPMSFWVESFDPDTSRWSKEWSSCDMICVNRQLSIVAKLESRMFLFFRRPSSAL